CTGLSNWGFAYW
nr:immunoglobulin heavy chain junction region [Mus musculus]